MASSSIPSLMKDEKLRNWADLPSELMSLIMLRLGVIDILENAQKVCTSWRRVSNDPSMWRKIDMNYDLEDLGSMKYNLEIMCRHAIDRSQGGLVEIDIGHFGTDNLLKYIADRASNLRSLRLAKCNHITDEGVIEAVAKLPLLEDLDFSYSCDLFEESLRYVGQSCPNLKTLKLARSPGMENLYGEADTIAKAIAESMPELCHLQLFGIGLTNVCMNVIIEGCPHLEHHNLRSCLTVLIDAQCRRFQRNRALRRRTYDIIIPNLLFQRFAYNDYYQDVVYEFDSDHDFDYGYGGEWL